MGGRLNAPVPGGRPPFMPVSSPGGWASGLQESLEGVWPRRRALLWHHDAPCAAKGGEGATDAAGTGCVRAAARCPAGRSRARTSAHHPGSCAGARWAPPAGPPAAAGHSPLAGAGGKKTRPTLDRLFAARLAPLQASSIVVNLVTVSSESPLGVVPRSLVRSLHASAVDRPHQSMQRRVGVAVRGRAVATKGSPTLEKDCTGWWWLLPHPPRRGGSGRGRGSGILGWAPPYPLEAAKVDLPATLGAVSPTSAAAPARTLRLVDAPFRSRGSVVGVTPLADAPGEGGRWAPADRGRNARSSSVGEAPPSQRTTLHPRPALAAVATVAVLAGGRHGRGGGGTPSHPC